MAATRHLPRGVWDPAAQLAGAALSRFPVPAVKQWMLNAETMTGTPPCHAQTRRAVVSWARTLVTSMQLPGWSRERIDQQVDFGPGQFQVLRDAVATRGAVVALPHMASWDLAGAWVAGRGVPISTVAEQLPDAEFELFVRTRERLGMKGYGHRQPQVASRLVADLREGRLISLVADRDFSRRGVAVNWLTATGPVPGSMPPGPAHLAVLTGAALVGVVCSYTSPDRMRIEFSPVLEPADQATSRERAAALTCRLAEWFSPRIAAQVHDWHMFQPFFTGLGADPARTTGTLS